MVTPQMLDYIRSQLASGISQDAVKKSLTTSGWAEADITQAFASLGSTLPPSPAATVPAQAAPVGITVAHPMSSHGMSRSLLVGIVVGIVVLAVGGGVGYAYMQKLGPFAHIPYAEDNLLSGLLDSFSHINTSSYKLSGSLGVGPRDTDAKPFELREDANSEERLKLYQHDQSRATVVQRILSALSSYRYSKLPYPSTLAELAQKTNKTGCKPYSSDESTLNAIYLNYCLPTKDPVNGAPLSYRTTQNSTDFELTATFETNDAVSSIARYRSYFSTATSTIIEDKTVIFTRLSSSYISLPSEPPKPFLVQLGETLRYLPAEVQAVLSVGATADWSDESNAWKFNVDATGDFGDLTYKVDVDAQKSGDAYYVRVNNIPSLFGSDLANMKGQWIKIPLSTSTLSSSSYSEFNSLARELPDIETQYKKNRAELSDFLKKVVQFADEEHLVSFKNPPRSDWVEGKQLYRYDLTINKSAIVPFYKKMVAEAVAHKETSYSSLFNDPGMIDYLESDEFSQVFDYYNANTTLTLWADSKGYPEVVKYSMRIVPPDTATQLVGKQVNVVLELLLTDINASVNIEAPKDAKPVEDIIKDSEANRRYGSSGVALTKSYLSTLRSAAELAYAKTNSYGTKSFSLGSCASTAGTIFGDSIVFRDIEGAAGEANKATCASDTKNYAVSVPITADGKNSWCVDSTGASKQISGAIKGTSCGK
jgi:hypothetical protein